MQRYEFAVLTLPDADDQHTSCLFSHREGWERVECALPDTLRELGDAGFALVGIVAGPNGHLCYLQRSITT